MRMRKLRASRESEDRDNTFSNAATARFISSAGLLRLKILSIKEFGEFMIFADFAAISSPLPKEFD
jgi:hypothetical protein